MAAHNFTGTAGVVAIHQPAYLPWLGYLHKIYYAEKFVILDDVKYSKNSFIKRALIRKPAPSTETQYLSVPLKKHSDYAPINQLQAAGPPDWRSEHLRKIRAVYGKYPRFGDFFPGLEAVFNSLNMGDSLMMVTNRILAFFLESLSIERRIFYASALYPAIAGGDAHDRNMALVSKLGGCVYFSGPVARDYQEGKPLPDGVRLIYQEIWSFLEKNPYGAKENFVNGLSALDALFTIGTQGILALFDAYEKTIV